MAKYVRILVVSLCIAASAFAQDQRESLGPKDEPGLKNKPNPLSELMQSLHSQLRPELKGQHPRVYVTSSELIALRERAKTTHKELWQNVLKNLRALQRDPPPPPAEARRAQNDVAIAIAEAALAYAIERDPRYLAAAKKYMDAAISYDVWGYSFNKPNVDLAAGHLLYGLGMGYDLLYNNLTPAEREKYRDKLAKQAQLLADYYKPKPGRSYSYSQNHVFIPIAGLAVAAYALYDEVPNAPQWAALSRAIYDRVLATYSPDGYYYEGFEYWVFSTPWIIHYLDAHKHATGEDLFDHPGLRNMHYYLAHVVLPGGHDMFDFGDVFEGQLTRAKQGDEYERSHPGGHLAVNYNLLYDLAGQFEDSKIQGVAEYMKSLGAVNAEDFWSLIWYNPGITPTPIKEFSNWHHFRDHDVVFWRSDWTPNATAIAFKCGPPEGHHTAALLKKFPDWHLSAGHSHPDANSFILFSKGSYLTGDSGYAGVPMTQQHNTLLIDGKGQGNEGSGHDPWDGYDYDRLDKIRIADVQATATTLKVVGDAAAAYGSQYALQKFERQLSLGGKSVSVHDDIRAEKPHIYTVLLHADRSIAKDSKGFLLHDGSGAMRVNVLAPPDYAANIEPNKVTAPGRPGSVDKGEVQVRGEKLEISNRNASNNTEFKIELRQGN